jgi:hypothetical protein
MRVAASEFDFKANSRRNKAQQEPRVSFDAQQANVVAVDN